MARILWRNSPWALITDGFSNKPIVDWILAIIFPAQTLVIPVSDVKKFQLFATTTLDNIWRARNILMHDGVEPVPSRIAF